MYKIKFTGTIFIVAFNIAVVVTVLTVPVPGTLTTFYEGSRSRVEIFTFAFLSGSCKKTCSKNSFRHLPIVVLVRKAELVANPTVVLFEVTSAREL